ncbi:hypothetical protein [Desulfonema magnum]|uniref:hypothetical protein n=1 Tax=Desulfonema magnum TaxID=45655 RepID=UPI001A9B058F|nr:hypothetical protein [Desulfonema magnum]
MLLSSWHYRNIYKTYSLRPVLVGVRNGKTHQKRILVGKDKSVNPESSKTGRIASATSIQHTKSVLREMFREKGAADKAKILTVPKDIDALMSVGFGMSQCALTTRNSLEKLKKVNPVLYRKMTILSEGRESLLLILATPESFTKDAESILRIIQNMSGDPDGRNKIKMIGLDGWQKFDPSDESKLEG